jgi:hypothetical protein
MRTMHARTKITYCFASFASTSTSTSTRKPQTTNTNSSINQHLFTLHYAYNNVYKSYAYNKLTLTNL